MAKEAIAFAQAYFVTQTRTIELLQQHMVELERIDSREKLKITEKEFSNMAFSRGGDAKGIGEIRAKGDEALFGGKTTDEMKQKFDLIGSELSDTAKRQDVIVLEKYINLWEPLNFVTRNEVEKLINSIVESKKGLPKLVKAKDGE